jgi:hypothetical protein
MAHGICSRKTLAWVATFFHGEELRVFINSLLLLCFLSERTWFQLYLGALVESP